MRFLRAVDVCMHMVISVITENLGSLLSTSLSLSVNQICKLVFSSIQMNYGFAY